VDTESCEFSERIGNNGARNGGRKRKKGGKREKDGGEQRYERVALAMHRVFNIAGKGTPRNW